MKKWLPVLLAALLLTGCAGKNLPTVPDPGVTLPIFPDRQQYYADHSANLVVGGSTVTAPAGQGSGSVSYGKCYPGSAGHDYTDPKRYTFREYISGTTGMKWAPHTWETRDDSYILGYTTTGF